MQRTLNVKIPEKTFDKLLEIISEANRDFNEGKVTTADVVTFALERAQIDIHELRSEKLSVKKFLQNTIKNSDEISVEELIQKLQKIQNSKKKEV